MKSVKKIIAIGLLMTMGVSLLTGCNTKVEVEEFKNYAKSVEEITLSDEVRIVALGEATHGNKEFQELKLDVFAHLVETTDVRGFALEGDFSSCAIANDYILHDEGTAEEAVKNLGFEIYRTDEMLELVEWMHTYNQSAAEKDKVRIYGFDMQRDEAAINRINDFYNVVDEEKGDEYATKLDALYGKGDNVIYAADLPDMKVLVEEIIADIEENADAYESASNEELYAYALQAANCLLQNVDLHGAGNDYSEIRDKYMAENVKWILNREENIHGTQLMIAGHNGHVAKVVNSSYTNMGYYLSQEMQEEYYVIGTDFYNTTCSIATKEAREDYGFCSDDPLAKAVGDMEENIYYLDFADAKGSEELSNLLNSNMKTGSLGESYSPLMKVLKYTYQLSIAPSKLYDGMIFVYEATPIEVWDYQE